jgi:hypothetical protein
MLFRTGQEISIKKTYTVFIITRINGARNAPEQRKMRIVEERTVG